MDRLYSPSGRPSERKRAEEAEKGRLNREGDKEQAWVEQKQRERMKRWKRKEDISAP